MTAAEKWLTITKGCGFTQPLTYLREDKDEAPEIVVAKSTTAARAEGEEA